MADLKMSKRFKAASAEVEALKLYQVDEALKLVKQTATAKFDETIDLTFRLGIDPRHADQMIRGALALPSGTGKTVKICVITSGEKIKQAEDAGADFVGSDDLITKIGTGWLDFDRMIASPEMMGKIGKIGRVLGPRGLMPNPKLGTVTPDVAKAVKEQKSGKVEYRSEKTGIVQVIIGKKSFGFDQLKANFMAVAHAIVRAKPSSSKGNYIKSLTISSTMGPGIRMNPVEVIALTSSK